MLDGARHRFADVYYIQPHNTYDYGDSLKGWLDAGFRSLELDVLDPGDWENHPDGPHVAHGGSGEQNNCSSGDANDRLGHCLRDILDWLADHPDSVPLLILVDMKGSPFPGEWTGAEVALLDEYVRAFLGETLYSFEELYLERLLPLGGSGFPRELAAEHGWPSLDELRGRVVVALTGGRLFNVNRGMDKGLTELYFRKGRYPATFLCPGAGSDPRSANVGGAVDDAGAGNSQFFLCLNLKARRGYERTACRAARNRQIVHLWGSHLGMENTRREYSELAVASGVQAIGRDLEQPSEAETWDGSIPLVGLRGSCEDSE